MNTGLVTSFILLWCFFYLSGMGFSILLLPINWWRSYWSVVLFPILGIAIHLILAGVFIPRGVQLGTSTWLTLFMSLSVCALSLTINQLKIRALIKSFRFIAPSSKGILLSLALLLTPVISIFFIESNSVMNVRLGIDAALYGDGAQSLLANENVPRLENIASLHPGSLSTALFFQNFRWGSAFLLAISAQVTGNAHSLTVGIPLFALVLFLIAGITLRVIFYRRTFSLSIAILAVMLSAGNTFFVRLVNEGQWPNLIAILLVPFLLFITIEQYSKFDARWPRIQLFLLSSMVTCSILITYAEILPLLMAIIVVGHLAGSISGEKRKFLGSFLAHVISIMAAVIGFFFLINRPHIEYFKFLLLPSYANVGYPSPRSVFLSDMLGITDLWRSPSKWLSPSESVQKLSNPDIVGLSLINIVIIVFLFSMLINSMRINTFELHQKNQKISIGQKTANETISSATKLLTLGLIALFLYACLSSLIIQKSDYILIKAASILLIPLIIQFLSIEGTNQKRNKPTSKRFTGATALISAVVLFTNINSVYDLRSHSTNLLKGSLAKTWSESSKSGCLYLFNKRGQEDSSLRYVDRTVDYLLETVFREDVVLDPWTNQSIARPIDVKTIENRNICLALRGNDFARYRQLGYLEVFHDKSWLVLDTQMTYKEIVDEFGVLENFQTSVLG